LAGVFLEEDAGGRSRPPGIAQYLLNELRQAFRDMRQKVVEEGWFGRVVSPEPVVEVERPLTANRDAFYGSDHHPLSAPGDSIEDRLSFENLWRAREREAQPEIAPERGQDIDR
jgi:hypothetical protein